MAVKLDGAALAAKIKMQIREEAAALPRPPMLAVVLAGEDPASQIYVRGKERDCAECGVHTRTHRLPAEVSQGDLLALVEQLNQDEAVDGILVQLPLPEGLDPRPVLHALAPEKDVDGFHPLNAGLLALGEPGFQPCTPAGVLALLDAYDIPIRGRRCVVLGRSHLVGRPLAQLLTARDGTSGGHPGLRRGPCRSGDGRHGKARGGGRRRGHEPPGGRQAHRGCGFPGGGACSGLPHPGSRGRGAHDPGLPAEKRSSRLPSPAGALRSCKNAGRFR